MGEKKNDDRHRQGIREENLTHSGGNDAGGGSCQRRSPPPPPLASAALALVVDCRPRIGVRDARQTLSNNCPSPIIITGAMASSVATAVVTGRSAALAPSSLVAVLEGGRQRRHDVPHREDDGGIRH